MKLVEEQTKKLEDQTKQKEQKKEEKEETRRREEEAVHAEGNQNKFNKFTFYTNKIIRNAIVTHLHKLLFCF